MGKPSESTVRLQIPVSYALADRIADYAKYMERTQAWVAVKLLTQAVLEPVQLGDWLSKRVRVKRKPDKPIGLLEDGENDEVRLQLHVEESVAERIEDLGKRLNHTPVRMAALLLDFGVENYQTIVRIMGTSLVKAFTKKFFGREPQEYESAELADDEDELP